MSQSGDSDLSSPPREVVIKEDKTIKGKYKSGQSKLDVQEKYRLKYTGGLRELPQRRLPLF